MQGLTYTPVAALGSVEVQARLCLVDEAGGALVDHGIALYFQVYFIVAQDPPGCQQAWLQEVSGGVRRCQEVSGGVWRCQEVSGGVRRCQPDTVRRCQE